MSERCTAEPCVPVGRSTPGRRSTTFKNRSDARRYWLLVIGLVVAAVGILFGVLSHNNPMPLASDPYWRIARLRAGVVCTIVIVAICQSLATVSFQTIANNRIITPSILGFEALYIAIQTGTIFLAGATTLSASNSLWHLALRIAILVAAATLLYTWLLTGRRANMHLMLLVGIVIGGGLAAVSTFMQRLLTPSEFDILAARLFGNIANAEESHLPLAIPLVLVTGLLLYGRARRLDVLALGPATATNLGLSYSRELRATLLLISILMAVSTALVGPMTFLGFLVAMLTYQLAPTGAHRYLFGLSTLLAVVVLGGAYYILRNFFYAQGMVMVIIELVGATTFLIVLLRKGRL